jgi:cytochrome P450
MRTIGEYQTSRTIVASGAFGSYRIAQTYRDIAAQTGQDFAAAITLLERLPVFMDGDGHKATRKELALRLARHRTAQLDAADRFLEGFAAERMLAGSRFDLLHDYAFALFRAMGAPCVPEGVPAAEFLDLTEELPDLFSSFTPLRRRVELNQRLAALLALSVDADDVIPDLAMMVLGVKSLSVSLALSLHAVIAAHEGVSLRAMDWPGAIPASSVHFADRIARQAMEVDGEHFAAGERVRCLVHVDEWTGKERADLMFGAGGHLCLGRTLSDQVWARTVAVFSAPDLIARVEPLVIRRDGEPFHLPATCPVALD